MIIRYIETGVAKYKSTFGSKWQNSLHSFDIFNKIKTAEVVKWISVEDERKKNYF